MSTAGYNTRGKIACVRCKQRHKPPVGASCPRSKTNKGKQSNKDTSPQVVDLGSVDAAGSNSRQGQVEEGPAPAKTTKRKQPTNADVMDKLSSMMVKFNDLEKRLDQHESKGNSSLSLLSRPSAHSSPKRPCPTHSRHAEQASNRTHSLPSLQYLKHDSRVQAEVDRRLRQYEDMAREEDSGTSNKLKSGRYRLGDQKVKKHVHWPHEFCAVGDNLKMPTYEDINVYQWVQGFSRCALEESDPQVRTHMLQYQGHLMQEALELNWATAKRAHAAVLTEIERGYTSWGDQTQIDRIRQRFTQRALKNPTTSNEEQVRICKHFNEGNCSHTKDHVEGRVTYKHACFACHKAVKRHYPHPEEKCNRAKRMASHSSEKQRL